MSQLRLLDKEVSFDYSTKMLDDAPTNRTARNTVSNKKPGHSGTFLRSLHTLDNSAARPSVFESVPSSS
ncbi:hypothetical protein ElyMa_003064500 [Elysia marginata]|uniref:Uncharacterized protein n=1 Tax=Elysia marginata TaxID=1093978 RepID=A0AAV4IEQ9_9GAST|nr:hypothetical protein ElyMa_003064500 [Elysia marginata]